MASTSSSCWTRFITILFAVAVLIEFGSAARNVTIDDFDTLIQYSPADAWRRNQLPATAQNYAGTESYTESSSSVATFTFQGSAIYFIGRGQPTKSVIRVELDGVTTVVDAQRPVNQSIQALFFHQVNLDASKEHTIVIRNGEKSILVVDAFIVTKPDEDASNSSSGPNTSLIAGATVGAFAGGLLLAGVLFYIHKRRRKVQFNKETTADTSNLPTHIRPYDNNTYPHMAHTLNNVNNPYDTHTSNALGFNGGHMASNASLGASSMEAGMISGGAPLGDRKMLFRGLSANSTSVNHSSSVNPSSEQVSNIAGPSGANASRVAIAPRTPATTVIPMDLRSDAGGDAPPSYDFVQQQRSGVSSSSR